MFRRPFPPCAAVTVLAVTCVLVLAHFRNTVFQTSVYDLAGDRAAAIPAAVRTAAARKIPVLFETPAGSATSGGRIARRFLGALDPRAFAATDGLTNGLAAADTLAFVRRHRAGLAAPEDQTLLSSAAGRSRIARRALKRHWTSPVPPLFGFRDDPFLLTERALLALPAAFSDWTFRDGFPTRTTNGVTSTLVVLETPRNAPDETAAACAAKQALDRAVATIRSECPDVRLHICGLPVHTAVSAERCKAEINVLSALSLVFIALLAYVIFRGFRQLPYLACALVTAASAGTGVLLIFFDRIHSVTFVFGTAILGLVIDYAFHWLLKDDGPSVRAAVWKNLRTSCLTTVLSLLPLLLSSIPALRQSAVFLAAGLVSTLLFVRTCFPRQNGISAPPRATGDIPARLRFIPWAAALFAAASLFFLRTDNTPSALYRPTDELRAAEARFARLNGHTDPNLGFLVTAAADLEAALAREASLGLPPGVPHLSGILPTLARRESVAAQIRKLYDEHAAALAKALGVPVPAPPPPPAAWQTADLPPALADTFLRADASGVTLVVSAVRKPPHLPAGTRFCQPAKILSDLLAAWLNETTIFLGGSLVLLLAVLLFARGRRALRIFLSVILALGVTVGALSVCGCPLTLFHLLALFLLAGTGVDYALFCHDLRAAALKPVLCSMLTSTVGFGALAFVSLPVVRAFGTVLGLGLPVSFLLALATVPPRATAERAASPLGLEALWLLYRAAGLRLLHAAADAVGTCVWCASPAVRRAARTRRRLLNFTRALADKTVVLSGAKDTPAVTLEPSADATDFIAAVRDRRGVFVLSTHVGTIEMLAALGECPCTFHAWTDLARTAVFNRFYLRHANRPRVVLHAIADIGLETGLFAADALARGDCLLMAGDRGDGAFRFARAMSHPVFAAAALREGNRYRILVRRLPDADRAALKTAFFAFRDALAAAHPDQCFDFT